MTKTSAAKTADITCTCTGDHTPEHVATVEESRLFVVTTWTCVRCDGQVFADWQVKAA